MQENMTFLDDPIAKPVQEFITIFSQEMPQVSFPDINQSILESLSKKIQQNAQTLQDALSKAEEARKALESSQQELLLKTVRGLAYARVYAEDNPTLSESLAKINLGKAARAPRKTADESSKTTVVDAKPQEKKPRQPKKPAEPKAETPVSL